MAFPSHSTLLTYTAETAAINQSFHIGRWLTQGISRNVV